MEPSRRWPCPWPPCSAVPGSPVPVFVWLPAHVVAVSGGWIAASILVDGSVFDAGALLGFILGVLCYGVVSGSIMCCVVRGRRPEAAQPDPVGVVQRSHRRRTQQSIVKVPTWESADPGAAPRRARTSRRPLR